MPCWYFDKKEIKNSPTFRDGIDTATENRYRREGARFIIDAGSKMGLLYDTCATGVVYYHRFYMFHSFREFYRYVTAACCLFLAGKVEETPKKCKDIIKIAQSLLSPASFLRFGEDPREEVMTMERILLKTIKFDLQVEHPYGCMLKYAKYFKGDREKTQKMAQMAWTFINDSLCTTLCLQWEPEIIAVSMMYLASRLTKFEPSDWLDRSGSKSKWWEDFMEGMSLELMEDICHQVLDLYSSKQKKTAEVDSPPPSPAKANKQAASPPPPPPQTERGYKRTREEVSQDMDPPSKMGKLDKEVKAVPTTISSGAPIPVAQHRTPSSSSSQPSYSMLDSMLDSVSGMDYSSYNPYVSSQMYSSSFMSQEGAQNIQSILAGTASSSSTSYPETHSMHQQQQADTSQYQSPQLPPSDLPNYSYSTPQSQYSAPPPHHPYPPLPSGSSSSAPLPYDSFSVNPSHYPGAAGYPSPSVNQPPPPQPQHSYPVPAPPAFGNFYPNSGQAAPQPPLMGHGARMPGYPPYPNHPPLRHQGGYQKHGKHGGQRKDLTKVKISGRP